MYSEVFCRNAPLIYADHFEQVYYPRYKILQNGVGLAIGPLFTTDYRTSRSEFLPVIEGQSLRVDIRNVGDHPAIANLLVRTPEGPRYYLGDLVWSGWFVEPGEVINMIVSAPWTGEYALYVINNDPSGRRGLKANPDLRFEVYGSLSILPPTKNPYKV